MSSKGSLYEGVGKVAIITGAGSGIGEAIAYALSSSGVRLVINGRTESKLRKVASNIEKKGGSVEVVVGDAGTEETAKRLVDTAIEKYGQLDIAVNNSARAHISKIYELTSEKIDEMVSTNIKGIIYGMKYQLPAIGKYSTKESPGNIINISSTLSTLVSPKASIGWSVYSASKSFVDTLTKIGALEAQAFNVRVNSINPGPVQTAGLQRAISGAANVDAWAKVATLTDKAAEPWEIAEFTLDVIRNRYINGSALLIDAGMNAAA